MEIVRTGKYATTLRQLDEYLAGLWAVGTDLQGNWSVSKRDRPADYRGNFTTQEEAQKEADRLNENEAKGILNLERYDVLVSQRPAPFNTWDIFVRKMGGRFLVCSRNGACKGMTMAFAKELAEFLDIPLVVRENENQAIPNP